MNGKKSVAAAWMLLALLLPCMITGAAASEPESYIFERMPDIEYYDDFVLPPGTVEDIICFVYEGMIPEGVYYFASVSFDGDLFLRGDLDLVVSYDSANPDFWVGFSDETFPVSCVDAAGIVLDSADLLVQVAYFPADGVTAIYICDFEEDGSLFNYALALPYVELIPVEDSAASMSPILDASNDTLPSVITSVYDMIRHNELLAFFAFCGVLTAAVAVYVHLKKASHN